MTKAVKDAVSSIMGVIRQQTRALNSQDLYDAMDEIVDQSSDLFSAAKASLPDRPTLLVDPSLADNQGLAPLREVDNTEEEITE